MKAEPGKQEAAEGGVAGKKRKADEVSIPIFLRSLGGHRPARLRMNVAAGLSDCT